MSDSQMPEASKNVDATDDAQSDLVDRVNENLADAEAASAAATDNAETADEVPADAAVADAAPVAEAPAAETAPVDAPDGDAPVTEEPPATDEDLAAARAHIAAMGDDDDTPWYDREDVTTAADNLPESVREPAPLTPPAAAEEVPAETVVAPAATAAAAQQPIFVQAPEPPRKRGNRGFSGVVALLATVIFALGYLAARLFLSGQAVAMDGLAAAAVELLPQPRFWVPVLTFFLAFWLLGAFLNNAKWGYWVVFGLLVGVAAMGGHVLGELVNADIFRLTAAQGAEMALAQLATWPALIAFVLGRELPVWFGGWTARRGRTVIAANAEAQEEYQRTLEAGPQIVQQ